MVQLVERWFPKNQKTRIQIPFFLYFLNVKLLKKVKIQMIFLYLFKKGVLTTMLCFDNLKNEESRIRTCDEKTQQIYNLPL
jgi:hypothetical protein